MYGPTNNATILLEEMKCLGEAQNKEGSKKMINSELWHACAGPLVSLPQPGHLVYYFPQGHSEQVTASTKKTANSHIPNYPSLTSQLICQVHNVTLHADKETDEIYAQMTLQPVNSEQDIFPFPDFDHTKSKQPNEFFCKTLTASDTSTHGGFSVPRRAAEKLFPQLDYTMQPPNQELIVRDLHDNIWTFRHIYRGQPKRHLLTTGWSSFVGAKRLKAGDSVLFIRDAKSQLLLGVRRANRQQTAMPSSVLSTDSMHIGVLAAAAHAASNCSPFTVYYNPRACPSEFIIPLSRYHRAAYTQISIGMRFGMMFETEESTKRRYMGTVVGISDYDPIRWPNSKWRNLQVEWDEHGYGERPDRVSIWEIETPDNLFVFPTTTTTSFKRQCLPGFVGIGSEELLNMILKPQMPNLNRQFEHHLPTYASSFSNIKRTDVLHHVSSSPPIISTQTMTASQQNIQLLAMQQAVMPLQSSATQYKEAHDQVDQRSVDLGSNSFLHFKPHETCIEKPRLEQIFAVKSEEQEQETIPRNADETELLHRIFAEKSDKVDDHSMNISRTSSPKLCKQLNFQLSVERNGGAMLDSAIQENHASHTGNEVHINVPELPKFETIPASNLSPLVPDPEIDLLPPLDHDDSLLHSSNYQSFTSPLREAGSCLLSPSENTSTTRDIFTIMNHEKFNAADMFKYSYGSDSQRHYSPTFKEEQVATSILSSVVQESNLDGTLQSISGIQDLSEESKYPNSIYGSTLHFDVCDGLIMDDFGSLKDSSFHVPSDCVVGKLTSDHDLQSQITSASLPDSQIFAIRECVGGASSSSIDANDYGIVNRGTMKQAYPQPLRTYTKVQKLGSVGRSIDVTRFKNYHDLRCTIACMFGLEGQLEDPNGSEWKLVYVDYEEDVLLVGDDPWEEFVNCVRCIRILSSSEVQNMSQEDTRFANIPTFNRSSKSPVIDGTYDWNQQAS